MTISSVSDIPIPCRSSTISRQGRQDGYQQRPGRRHQNNEDEDNDHGTNNAHARSKYGMLSNGEANNNSAEGAADEGGPYYGDDGGSGTQHQQATQASHHRNASGQERIKGKTSERQPDLVAIAAGQSKRIKPTPEDTPESPFGMDGNKVPTDSGTLQHKATVRKASDMEDMYA